MPNGTHLIDGAWIDSAEHFTSDPVTGDGLVVAEATEVQVDQAAEAAEAAFGAYANTSLADRAAFLDRIATEIDALGDQITETGCAETGLPAARLLGERGRTTGQLRLFASLLSRRDTFDPRHDDALPDRAPLPRPDLKLLQRPIGPVAVFGASNFPLAFSTAGGDTASALAAGCPVIVKGHPAHPGTGALVAEAIDNAIKACGMPSGTFQLLQGTGLGFAQALVKHPLIQAVGFTGSYGAGRALFDLCNQRPQPIPCYAEMGSVNPVFVLPEALKARGEAIGSGWAGSLTMGVGQFCTNPGLLIIPEGPEGDALIEAAKTALANVAAQPMLTSGIAGTFAKGCSSVASADGVTTLLQGQGGDRSAAPTVVATDAATLIAKPGLAHEIFGPFGMVVRVSGAEEMVALAKSFEGQLTCTLQLDAGDHEIAAQLTPILERKAGRLLANGFPTGVEVADAMMHGGPWPAASMVGTTSVGTLAIRRFLRPVSYQNWPDALMPAAWSQIPEA